MLNTIRKALQIEEIRKKLWFTFLMLIVVRLGSQLPTPGVNPEYVQSFFASQTGEAFNFFNAFTGGSFALTGFFAFSGIFHPLSSMTAPLIRPCKQYRRTIVGEILHFSAVCLTDKYFIIVLPFSGLFFLTSCKGATYPHSATSVTES